MKKINDEVISEELTVEESKTETQEEVKTVKMSTKQSNKYKIIAIKPTFVVLRNEQNGELRSKSCNFTLNSVGDIVEESYFI